MRISKRYLTLITIVLTSLKVCAQTPPSISYSPSTAALTQNTAMTAMTPTNSGGTVGSFSYGSGTGITGGTLDHPYGVATDASGNVYVANFGVDKKDVGSVSKYNPTSHTWTTFATDSINNPSAVVVDNSGNVYVLNYQRSNNGNGNQNGNGYITEYNSSGTLINTVVQGLGPVTGMAINNSNGNLDIAEENANGGNAVIAEYTTSGALYFTLSNANISNPVNVATDGSGNIYVLNNTPNQVVKFSSTGTYISTIVSSGFTNPYGLYVDGSGNIYVSDSTGGTNTIDVYNSAGTFLMSINGLTNPEGLATDSKGVLYVSDYTNNTLTQYNPTGGYFISGKLPPGLTFNYTTGTISGTPTTTFASTTYTITAYNAAGSSSTTVTLSCTGNASAPTITYDPNSVNVFTTNTAITALVPTVTGSPTNYSINIALPTGLLFSTSTGTITGTPTVTSAAKVYTITFSNASGSASTTISISCVVDNYWTGSKNADWNTKQNWSANRVPTSTDRASIGVINYTGSDPSVPAGETAQAYTVIFGPNAGPLTMYSTGTLAINSSLTVATNANTLFQGSSTTSAGSINVASTAYINVTGTGTLTIKSPVTLTLLSDANGSAYVSQITSGAIAGTVSVQRYITAHRAYRLMASPVNAVSGTADANGNLAYTLNYVQNTSYITGTTLAAGGFDVGPATTSENPTLYLYREDVPVSNASFISGNFRGISSLKSAPTYSLNNEASNYTIPVSNGFLFFYRGDRSKANFATETTTTYVPTVATLTATGTLNQGQIVFKDWYTPSSTAPGFSNANATAEGFNLAGNPYACTIDWETTIGATNTSGIYTANLSSYVYELNPANGIYSTYQAGKGGAVYTNSGSRYIASGQGFFVQATAIGGQLIFNESAKSVSQVASANLMMSKTVATNINPQLMRFEMAMDTLNKDNILVLFDSNARPGYVFNEDALYKTGSGKVSLSSISTDNQALSVNKLPLSDGLIVPLKIGASAYGNYTLGLTQVSAVPQVFDIWLKDAYTKDSVNMRTTASYSFAITTDTSSYGTKRFSIVMRENPALAYQLLTFTAGKTDNNKQVQLNWTTKNEENYTSFIVERSNDDGKTFEVLGGMTGTGAGAYGLADKSPLPGYNYYRLQQQDINGAITYSKVVQVMYVNTGSGIAGNLVTYPNPVKNTLNLLITRQTTGTPNYSIQIINASGLIIQQSTTTQPQWQGDVNSFLPGTYVVQVVDNKSKDIIGRTRFVKL